MTDRELIDLARRDPTARALYRLGLRHGVRRGERSGYEQGKLDALAHQPAVEVVEARPSKLGEAIELLTVALAEGPRFVSDLIALAADDGISRKTLYRARDALGVRSAVEEVAGRRLWLR